MFLCPFVGDAKALIYVSMLLGFSYGCGMALFPVYLGDLFGVANLPVIMGVLGLFAAGFAAMGPVAFGLSYDKTGSYNTAFILSGILCMICGIALYLLKQPKKQKA
jgi:MFS family permease